MNDEAIHVAANRFVCVLLFLCLAPPALACSLPADYAPIAERAPKALLYEAENCRGEVRYLFGTYHSDSPKLGPLIAYVAPYLYESDELSVEVVSSLEGMLQAQTFLHLPPKGPNLQSLIGNRLYAKTKELIAPQLGLSEQALQRFRPWALALLVQYPPPEADNVILDVRLQAMATAQNIPVTGLEQMSEQFAIFTDMPQSMQIDFLKSTLETFEDIQGLVDELEAHYLAGDLAAIERLSREQFDAMAEDYPELTAYIERKLIDERNVRMAEAVLEKAANPHFIAVGALHFPGKTGLLAGLEAKGYRIEPLMMPR